MSSKKRIQAFDMMRGGMIFYVIFLHALIHRVFASDGTQFEVVVDNMQPIFLILLSPLVLLSLWGTLFSFLSGASAAYSMGSQYQEEKGNLKDLTKKRILNSFILYLVFNFEKLFFSVRVVVHPDITHSMFTGSLEEHRFILPTLVHFLSSSTLESIAITSFLISIILFFLWRNNKISLSQTFWILIFLGFGNLILTNIIRSVFPDVAALKQNLLTNEHYMTYFVVLRVFVDRFAHFPVFAFGCFGAAFGVLLANKARYKQILSYGSVIGLSFVGLFLYNLFSGFDLISSFHEEMVPLPLQYLNIGLQILVLTALLRVMDFRKKPLSPRGHKMARVIRKYSDLSLTIYIMEPFISQVWYLMFAYFNGGMFSRNFPVMLLFLETVIISWWIIVHQWHKHGLKYSYEWWMAQMKDWMTTDSPHYKETRKYQKYLINVFQSVLPSVSVSTISNQRQTVN